MLTEQRMRGKGKRSGESKIQLWGREPRTASLTPGSAVARRALLDAQVPVPEKAGPAAPTSPEGLRARD